MMLGRFWKRLCKGPQWLWEMGHVLAARTRGTEVPVLVTSMDLAQNPTVRGLFGQRPVFYSRLMPMRSDVLLGWGHKMSGRRARQLSDRAARVEIIEDGFLRSVTRHGPACALACDRDGIYYDPASPSRLFQLIPQTLTPEQTARARHIMALWRRHGVSKYNDAPDYTGDALPEGYVLVVDQVARDLSIRYGADGPEVFDRMIQAALADHPTRTIVLKAHPDNLAAPHRGGLDMAALRAHPRVRVIDSACHLPSLIAPAHAVYTVSSQAGFEALIWGKPVHVFGRPFYAGWGLTRDAVGAMPGRETVTLEQIVHAALVGYCRYWHPALAREVQVEDIIALLGEGRRHYRRAPVLHHAVGFSRWKRRFLRDFLTPDPVRFVSDWAHVPRGGHVVAWGRKGPQVPLPDVSVTRMEDGFLRSAGLGADLIRPLSLVRDDRGIYFDATRPSRLEEILSAGDIGPEQETRGQAVIDAVVRAGVDKYNLGGVDWSRPQSGPDAEKRVLLVVGQVEGDASIAWGSPEVKTNLELVRRVRAAHPHAYLVFKPHPDVLAGLRQEVSPLAAIAPFCNEVVTKANTLAMLAQVDEVHTITSLLGFEALIRGTPVVCHGLPFYAGWGLTQDMLPLPRRARRLSVAALAYGVFVAYPRYIDPVSRLSLPVQDAIALLEVQARQGPRRATLFRRMLRAVLGGYNRLIRRT